MSLVSSIFSFDPHVDAWRSKESLRLAKQLCNASQFLRGLRVQMRFGELTRAPLRLLRLHVLEEVVECDWLARAPDPWDAGLSRNVRQRHGSLQALKDAIDVRALLFDLMPQVETAYFRVYRESSDFAREMIVRGYVQRNDNCSRDVHSLVMRAKVLGFHFNLENDILCGFPTEEQICVGG
ncbi:MAG: hypothetical protein KGM96_14505 [Acidobacteriota bacterium]|nr:hypothetical protein [Acidobacteriota bacterium]